jgi:hypothetical protein
MEYITQHRRPQVEKRNLRFFTPAVCPVLFMVFFHGPGKEAEGNNQTSQAGKLEKSGGGVPS